MGSLGSQEPTRFQVTIDHHNWSQWQRGLKRCTVAQSKCLCRSRLVERSLCWGVVETSWHGNGWRRKVLAAFSDESSAPGQGWGGSNPDGFMYIYYILYIYKFHISIELLHMIWFSSLRGLKTWMVQPWAVAERVFELQYSIMVKKTKV